MNSLASWRRLIPLIDRLRWGISDWRTAVLPRATRETSRCWCSSTMPGTCDCVLEVRNQPARNTAPPTTTKHYENDTFGIDVTVSPKNKNAATEVELEGTQESLCRRAQPERNFCIQNKSISFSSQSFQLSEYNKLQHCRPTTEWKF